jgi:hypothetical protein
MNTILKITKWISGLSFIAYTACSVYLIYEYFICKSGEAKGWIVVFLAVVYLPLAIIQFLLYRWSRRISIEHKLKIASILIGTLILWIFFVYLYFN